MNALALLALPIVTGFASVLWSRLVSTSAVTVTALSVVSYAIVAALLLVIEPRDTAWPIVGPAVAYVALSVALSLLWLRALSGASIGSCALAEAAYPVVVLIVSRVINGIGPLSWTTCIGAILVLIGTPLIAVGEHNR